LSNGCNGLGVGTRFLRSCTFFGSLLLKFHTLCTRDKADTCSGAFFFVNRRDLGVYTHLSHATLCADPQVTKLLLSKGCLPDMIRELTIQDACLFPSLGPGGRMMTQGGVAMGDVALAENAKGKGAVRLALLPNEGTCWCALVRALPFPLSLSPSLSNSLTCYTPHSPLSSIPSLPGGGVAPTDQERGFISGLRQDRSKGTLRPHRTRIWAGLEPRISRSCRALASRGRCARGSAR
jgi:hypothetical protein